MLNHRFTIMIKQNEQIEYSQFTNVLVTVCLLLSPHSRLVSLPFFLGASAEGLTYRRMLRISWTDHISKSEVLSMAGTAIRRRQLQFLGHVLRKQELEDVALTGKIEGKRARGKQRLTYISSLSQWMGKSERDIRRVDLDVVLYPHLTRLESIT